jgi:CHAD domain-containing protein
VHETRKTIKRMRALARLLRREIGERELRRVDGELRSAGRSLARARDAEVLAATLSDLREREPGGLASASVAALAARLRAAADSDGRGGPAAESSVLESVGRMRGELLRWSLLEHDPAALTDGLRLIYRAGRRRYRRAARAGGRDPRRMHDWRKRVKALYSALDMLGSERTEAAKPMQRADRLGELLGREHDLWSLVVYLQSDEQLDDATRAALGAVIERRRGQLRTQALALGAKLYEQKPKRFASRVGRALARRGSSSRRSENRSRAQD